MSLTWQDDSIEVFSTASGTITFKNDDVLKVFIDWDDGVNQTLKDGVNQWTSLPKAGGTIDLTHIYTQTGSFAPVVRTINSNGFVSKYYGSSTTNADLAPYETVGTKIPPITVYDGNPTGILKIENKTVLSGIDNNIFNEGPKQVYMYIPPIAETNQPDQQMSVTVTAKVAIPSLSGSIQTGYASQLQELTKTFVLGDGTAQPVNMIHSDLMSINEVVKMKMDFVKYPEASGASVVQSDALNKLKIFLIAQGDNDLWYPITYVSNGDPIKQADDSRRLVTLDFTESRAKAANASSSTFNVDDGKFSWQPYNQWQPATSPTNLSGNTVTTNKTIDLGYTYYTRANGLMGEGISANNYAISGNKVTGFVTGNATIPQATNAMVQDQFLLNDFNQFVDTYHLARMTVASNTGYDSELQTFDGLYTIDPPQSAVNREAYFFNDYGTSYSNTWFYGTKTYVNLLATNTHGYNGLLGSPLQMLSNFGSFNSTKSGTKGTPAWTDDYKRDAPQYLLFTNEKKVNKIFFNNTTYASKMMSNLATHSGATVAGVSYLRVSNTRNGDKFTQKAEWVPLQFTDTTRVDRKYRNSSSATYVDKSSSFAKSGYITFDMPSDWETLSLSGMSGGFFDVTGATDVTSSISGSNSNNPWSVYVTGMAIAPAISGTGDQFATYTFNDIGYPGNSTWYTDEDFGNYKYMLEVSSSSLGQQNVKQTLWIASSSVGYSSGTAASSRTLYLTSGANHYYLGLRGYLKGFIRRVNFYEVFDGASKTSSSGSLPNQDYAVTQDPTQYPYTFAWGGDGGDLSYYKQQWEGEKYALKIILSGAGGLETTSPVVPGAEMWTALPYNDNNSQVIIQKDNTAYDLSYMPINSDVSVNYAGTFYQAATKGGNVYIIRTGTPIQTIGLSSKAMGTEQSFAWSDNFTTFGTLEKLRDAQAEGTRVMWDEKQKDATWVRFFGVITSVSETHSVNGPRAPRDFTANLVVQEIGLIDEGGILISDIVPLGGVADARSFF
tara:strand:- start:1136 stop:4150 length:3015 start_codon:yes stop_codon:yes gene_type:complete